MSCDACRSQVKRETLHITKEGQALCQQCYGTYLSSLASLKARAHEVYRRCSCGAVLAPMGDTSVTPHLDGARSNLNLDFFFQPRKCECDSCGASFRVQHVVMSLVIIAVLGAFLYPLLRAKGDEVVGGLVLLAGFAAIIGHDVYCRLRYPRVTSPH